MSRKRTFIVRVNIDDMAAMIAGLDGPEEKAEWLDGYMVGVHGHPSRESWGYAKQCGYSFGSLHAAEVEMFRAEQSGRGKASAEKRLEKTGNSQPKRTKLEPPFEPPFEPIQQSNNPTIHEAKEPKNQRSIFVPPTLDELTTYAKEIGFKDSQKWMDHYVSNGWRVGKVKMADWKACVRNWNRSPIQGSEFHKPKQEPLKFGREYHESQRIVNADGTF